MKPFLILQLRENNTAADGEFNAFLTYGGLSSNDVVRVRLEIDELPHVNLDDYSGVIVGGGPWNVSDNKEEKDARQKEAEAWLNALLEEIVARDIPYLGACYGLGALSVNRGSVVSKKQFSEPVGAITVELTPEGLADPLLAGFPSSFRAIVGHKEACQSLPQGAVWLARSQTCPIQMYRVGHNVYATQFHPELDIPGICARIDVYKDAGYFPPEDAETIKAQLISEDVTIPTQLLKKFVEQKKRS